MPPDAVRDAPRSDDVTNEARGWLAQALVDERVVYFGVFWKNRLIGQIFLHNWEKDRRESMVGYHLFEPQWRGRGFGTKGLQLLQRFVILETDVARLVIITGNDNVPSLRTAKTCGFVEIGPSWEDPEHTTGLEWVVPR